MAIVWKRMTGVLCAGLMSAPLLMSAQRKPAVDEKDIVLHGTIAPEKLGTHESLDFTMPAGMQRMDVELVSPGMKNGMYLTVGLWDPQRYRGEGRQKFTITTVTGTGPYMQGPLVPGVWHAAIGFNWIAPTAHGEYTLKIHLSPKLDPETYPVMKAQAGWYKGDLHSHTGDTDAMCTTQGGKNAPCPPFRLFEAAAAQGLDFLVVTDHNTQATHNEMERDQLYFDRLLLIPGQEITTVKGHTNVWGTLAPLDYRVAEKGYTVNELFDDAHAHGALVSVNHFYWPYDGRCPGCGWGWKPITDFSKVDAIEIINGYHERGSWFHPPAGNGMPLWEEEIAKGLRPTGVGGGDDHRGGEQLPQGDGVGIPTTVVYAKELSQPAILAGLKAGHVYVMVEGPKGPDLLLNAGEAMMGDEIHARAGEKVVFTMATHDASRGVLRVFVDGKAVAQQPVLAASSDGRKAELAWTSDGKRHWVRAELDGDGGDPMTLTNPIYVNWR